MAKVKARYIGVAEYVYGVPARDLTEVEWAALSKEQQKAALRSGLYELAEEKKTATRQAVASRPKEGE